MSPTSSAAVIAKTALSLAVLLVLTPFALLASFVVDYCTRRAHPALKRTALLVAYFRAELASAGLRGDRKTAKILATLPWVPRAAAWLTAAYADLPIWRYLYPLYARLTSLVPHANHAGRDLLRTRTLFIDEVVAASPARQLVILGAGFDTRCHLPQFSQDRTCFEVDLAATQAAKREALSASRVGNPKVTYVPVDFNKECWLDRLVEQGFDLASPAVVVWEGVSYYLEPAAVDATAQLVAKLAPGSEVVLDFFTRAVVAGDDFPRLGKVLKGMGEPLLFGVDYDGDEGIEAWARKSGLQLQARVPVGRQGRAPWGGVAALRKPPSGTAPSA